MNLVIDIGNTLVKTATFAADNLSAFSSFEPRSFTPGALKKLLSGQAEVKNVILSSVAEYDPEISEFLKSKWRYVELTASAKIPVENLYRSPETLGRDRLALAVGASALFPKQNVLAVDAGTCIKYDFVNGKNQYLGGGISPGIDMRFRALNQFTDKLPLFHYTYFDTLIGQTTEESILSGVMNGTAEEVKGMLARYRQQYPDLKVVFTGGYLKFFEKIFNITPNGNSGIFADAFLVLKGLNRILNYNALEAGR